MNPQRIAAALVGGGALLGLVSVVALGAGAAGLDLPGVPRPPVTAPTAAAPAPEPVVLPSREPAATPEPEVLATAEVDPSLLRGGIDPTGVPLAHLEWLTLIPELDPNDPFYATPAQREEHMIRENALARCMAERGVTYHPSAWWLGQVSQPRGLSYDESMAFTEALYGPNFASGYDWTAPWTERGCIGAVEHEHEQAAAAGITLTADVPEPDPEAPTARQLGFVFAQAHERCMEDAGFEYLMPYELTPGAREYPPPGAGQGYPQMPASLSEAERVAWTRHSDGNPLPGAAYRWQDAGCSGWATHITGNDNMH
ncbi:hypothetical protein [Agromyces indicus]|uniref:Uncharacterized protein n=1 Tax=Agromyces indicus TaxID=758919 RepID=A0ABU1FFD8_9MICO|nr:hypothetical protein [Agromyces indicus]MDR5690459.1 hypothetical protein [Agromyces indicus]